jgi:hypothetical protein
MLASEIGGVRGGGGSYIFSTIFASYTSNESKIARTSLCKNV